MTDHYERLAKVDPGKEISAEVKEKMREGVLRELELALTMGYPFAFLSVKEKGMAILRGGTSKYHCQIMAEGLLYSARVADEVDQAETEDKGLVQ